MKYQISKLGEHGDFHVEDGDIIEVHPIKDGDHAADLRVRFRQQYQETGVFEWPGPGSKHLRLLLVPRQVKELVEQHREYYSAFCEGCYDYGKCDRPKASCARCLIIEAAYRSGQGDLRKAQTARREPPRYGLAVAMLLIIGVMWWALYQWGATAVQLESVQKELQAVRLQKR